MSDKPSVGSPNPSPVHGGEPLLPTLGQNDSTRRTMMKGVGLTLGLAAFGKCVEACHQENNQDRATQESYIRVLEMDKGSMDMETSNTTYDHTVWILKNKRVFVLTSIEPIYILINIVCVTTVVNLIMIASEVFAEFYTGGSHTASARYLFLGLHGHYGLVPWMWTALVANVVAAVMFLSSWVFRGTIDAALARSALQAIGQHPALEIGRQEGRRLALVLETPTASASHALAEWLVELPGVEDVNVAFVHWDDELAIAPALRPSSPSDPK
ncbi:hypothetical protein OAS39_06915 [Pirellulales bacterium]|nr:hypothetical protein [Pirellulales bacterium]